MKLMCKCGQRLSVPPELAGKEGRCPKCHRTFSVPTPDGGAVIAHDLEDVRPVAPPPDEFKTIPVYAPSVPVPVPLAAPAQAEVPPKIQGTVHKMNCPRCGRAASEYQPNKWKCLTCGTSFIYEPPIKPDRYVRIEKVEKMDASSFERVAESIVSKQAEQKKKEELTEHAMNAGCTIGCFCLILLMLGILTGLGPCAPP
jgi:hypothetical protein